MKKLTLIASALITSTLCTIALSSANAANKQGNGHDLKTFISMQEKQAAKKGWKFDLEKTTALFKKMDSNNDGIASGKERKTYWDNWKKNK